MSSATDEARQLGPKLLLTKFADEKKRRIAAAFFRARG
jgi:hypothetical protein